MAQVIFEQFRPDFLNVHSFWKNWEIHCPSRLATTFYIILHFESNEYFHLIAQQMGSEFTGKGATNLSMCNWEMWYLMFSCFCTSSKGFASIRFDKKDLTYHIHWHETYSKLQIRRSSLLIRSFYMYFNMDNTHFVVARSNYIQMIYNFIR